MHCLIDYSFLALFLKRHVINIILNTLSMIGTGKRFLVIISTLCVCGLRAYAQSPATKGLQVTPDEAAQPSGKTYALIVGISKYQYPECYPTLHYADVDARAFYNYMVSKTGGNVEPDNIDTLFNAGATQQDFWKKFNSIKNRLQKNDNFYIYFSGHGDAISSDLAFLLTYNAPPGNDRNNYYTTGGVVDIHALKSLIKMITLDKNKPAHVILITDACRSNELPPGKEEGRQQFYEEMYTKNAGEVQLVSCLANQVSYEDARWGGGRGLFSWHLVNGLMGMADNKPEDGVVTLKELINYVTDKVQDDSYDPVTKKYKQTPDYCCRDKDDVTMAHVDKATKDALAEQLKKGNGINSELPAYASNKGVNLGDEMNNEGLGDLYRRYRSALDENRLIDPADNNAMTLLQQILAKNIKPELKSDLKFELSSRLMNDVTAVMNTYLHASTNNNNYTFDYFNTAARKLRAFRTISDTLYYNQLDVQVNLLFLEGHSKWLSYKTADLKECLRKVDSAVALKPQASYLYNLKGLMHMSLKQYKEAEAALRKGIALAPNWLYPYHNLASTFKYLGKFDSSLVYFNKALKLDPNYQTTYGGIAGLYAYMGKYDSAIDYCKQGLQKDHTDPHLWVNLGFFYYYQKDWQNALNSFYEGIRYDSTMFEGYEGALMVHLDNFVADDSVYKYMSGMIRCDSTNPVMYRDLGDIFVKFKQDTTALKMYEKSIDIDSLNAQTWIQVAKIYKGMDKFDNAEGCLLHGLTLDPSANHDDIYCEMGYVYYYFGYNEKALKAFGEAILANPDNAVYYYLYGYVSAKNHDNENGEKYLRQAIKIFPEYGSAYYDLAKVLIAESKNSEALKMLEKAIKYGAYSKKDIEADTAFMPLKDDKQFQLLLIKARQ